MIYKRPAKNNYPINGVTVIYSDDEIVPDPDTNINVPNQVSYMEYFDFINPQTGLQNDFIFGPDKLTPGVKQKQAKFNELKSKCAKVAEVLNETLRNFLLNYRDINHLNVLDEIFKEDFLQVRNRFSDILKKDTKFWSIEKLNDPAKRKGIRKTFTDFIEDRNIYTHGHLHIRINDGSVIIKYIDKRNKKEASCVVDQYIIQSYFDTYSVFSKILEEMMGLQNKSQLEK